MPADFDYKRTPDGKKWLGEKGFEPLSDEVETFRNLMQGGERRPNFQDKYPVAPGAKFADHIAMLNVKRKLRDATGAGRPNKPFTTIELGTQVPVQDPWLRIKRGAQNTAWHGNVHWRAGEREKPARGPGRTEHASAVGRLPMSEAQQYLMGDAIPQDVHNYDVELDHKGQAVVLDEEGQPAPLLTYRPYTYDDNGNIVYRDDVLSDVWPEDEEKRKLLDWQVSGTGNWNLLMPGYDPITLPGPSFIERTGDATGPSFDNHLGVSTSRGLFLPRGVNFRDVSIRRKSALQEVGDVLVKVLY